MSIKNEVLIPIVIFIIGLIMLIGGLFSVEWKSVSVPLVLLGTMAIDAGVVLVGLKLTEKGRKRTKALAVVLAVALFLLLFPFVFNIVWYEILPWEKWSPGISPPDIWIAPLFWPVLIIFLCAVWYRRKKKENTWEAKQ